MIIRRIAPERELRKLRVAAYCRVSTTTEEQTESYETQMDYYTRFIKQNANWEYVDIDIPNKHFTLQTKSAIIRGWKMNYEVMPNIWGNKSSTNCARASSAC